MTFFNILPVLGGQCDFKQGKLMLVISKLQRLLSTTCSLMAQYISRVLIPLPHVAEHESQGPYLIARVKRANKQFERNFQNFRGILGLASGRMPVKVKNMVKTGNIVVFCFCIGLY